MVTEVIRQGTYRLKDDNGNVLTNTWNIEQLRHFFPKKFGLTIFFHLTFAPISTPAQTLLPWIARGLHEGAIPPIFFTILW